MPAWLFHGWAEDAVAAAKAAGMYAAALVGLRLAPRRTLSQWTAIDVAAAVALGAIIGRTAIAGDQSLAVGGAALVAILAANYVVALCRFHPRVAGLVDHRVKVLVDHGRLCPRELRRCGLIEDEVLAHLRRQAAVRGFHILRFGRVHTRCSSGASRARTAPDGSSGTRQRDRASRHGDLRHGGGGSD